MKMHGSTEGNLISAVRSASRLRSKPVHKDTIKYWTDLISHAQNEVSSSHEIRRLVSDLEIEVGRRPRR